MASPHREKVEMAKRWLAEPGFPLTTHDRELLEEFVRRYPDDPTLSPPERRRLLRGHALVLDRLGAPRTE
jgi:hypothetical protein